MMTNRKTSFAVALLFCVSFIIAGCGGKKDSTKTDSKTESTDVSDIKQGQTFEVTFDIKGNVTGTMDAIYADKKARIKSNMNVHGQNMTSTSYMDGQMVYIVSEIGGMKTGMKMDSKKYAESTGKKEGQYDVTSFKDHLKDYDKVGTEEILGRKCDIYQSKDGKFKISVYKETIPLKFDFGTMSFVATKLDTDVKVSDDTFTPPKDVTYMEMDDMMKDVGKMKDNMKNLQEKTKEMEDAMKKYNK